MINSILNRAQEVEFYKLCNVTGRSDSVLDLVDTSVDTTSQLPLRTWMVEHFDVCQMMKERRVYSRG